MDQPSQCREFSRQRSEIGGALKVPGNTMRRLVLGGVWVANMCAVAANELFNTVCMQNQRVKVCVQEVCCASHSRLTAECERKGLTARRLTLGTGFDFYQGESVRRAKQLIKEEKPRRGWISTPCTLWSSMQNCTVRTGKELLIFFCAAGGRAGN